MFLSTTSSVMDLDSKIEAILFFRGEPISIRDLARLLETPERNIREGLDTLEKKLAGRGVRLMVKSDEVMLATAPELSDLIEQIRKEELTKELGKAGLETLSIVLYKGPITRSEIDYIRGVNSTFILRNLMIRGLIERTVNPKDQRSFLYKPTFELLSFLGITKLEELPEFDTVKQELEEFSNTENEDKKREHVGTGDSESASV